MKRRDFPCVIGLAVAGLIGMCGQARGQDATLPSPLRLQDAIRTALARNPGIKAALSQVDVAEGTRLDASKRLNPAFTFNLENWRAFSPNRSPFFQEEDITTRVDYEIETSGRRRVRTEVAAMEVQAARAAVEDSRRLLTLDVQRAYFRAALAQTNLNVAREILGEIDHIIQLNQTRFASGEISGGELKRVELERLRFLEDVLSAQLDLRNGKSELLALLDFADLSQDFELGDALPVEAVPSGGLPGVPAMASMSELQEKAYRQRPDLETLLREEQRADTETALQRAIRSPNVTLGGGYKRAGPFNSVTFGLTVPMKVFNRNEGGVARAEAGLSAARYRTASVRTTLRLDVQKAYNAVQVNEERIRYIERQYLMRSEESRRIATASYRLGEANLIDLLDAERVFRETRRIYNQALYDYRVSLYELGAAVGEKFPL